MVERGVATGPGEQGIAADNPRNWSGKPGPSARGGRMRPNYDGKNYCIPREGIFMAQVAVYG
jgi:hypothetical protein